MRKVLVHHLAAPGGSPQARPGRYLHTPSRPRGPHRGKTPPQVVYVFDVCEKEYIKLCKLCFLNLMYIFFFRMSYLHVKIIVEWNRYWMMSDTEQVIMEIRSRESHLFRWSSRPRLRKKNRNAYYKYIIRNCLINLSGPFYRTKQTRKKYKGENGERNWWWIGGHVLRRGNKERLQYRDTWHCHCRDLPNCRYIVDLFIETWCARSVFYHYFFFLSPLSSLTKTLGNFPFRSLF